MFRLDKNEINIKECIQNYDTPIVSSNSSFNILHAASGREVVAMTCIDFFLPDSVFVVPSALAIRVSTGGVRSKALNVEILFITVSDYK